MKMGDFMQQIREELRKFKYSLENDIDEFNLKLNLSREDFSSYIDQQIEYLIKKRNEYNDELNYLDEENTKTCKDNQQEFDKLCLAINKNDHDRIIVSKLFEEFKQKFPMRPKMLKSIPQYHFKDIQIDDFIIKQNSSISPTTNENLSTSVINKPFKSYEHAFIPIDTSIVDDTQISTLPTTSIGSSYHKKLASQNNENDIEPQSRLVSTCSTINGPDDMVDISFKIPYQHNRSTCLMCFNEEEDCLLIYSLSPRQLAYLSLNSRQISLISLPFDEPILNLGYSTTFRLFYLSTRQTNRFVLFRLNEQEKQIEIENEIELINAEDHFISVHIYENFIYFLYLSSSIVRFGKYDLETSSSRPSISFEKKLYDHEDKSTYNIIDFAINNSFISFLIQLKNQNKFKINIYDYDSMDQIHSFDLIDAIKPLSIISTENKSTSTATTMSNGEIKLLLFVNDLKSHLIHCCTYEQYLIPIQVNAFGICALNNGNLALIASKDIRGLNVQDYLKNNNV